MVNLGDGLDSSGGGSFDKALLLKVVVWFVMRGVVGLAGASDFLGDGGGVARCMGGAVFSIVCNVVVVFGCCTWGPFRELGNC
jgi:hypothetical protein